ncbi:MAG: NADPH-dependent F420 reductase [Acidobacteria bacterium]|nr:NADPH-dependent F420 reductase [Acidobacteriota bacterium]
MSQFSMIAVLGGTGQQGCGLARRFALAGLPVVVGSRDPGRAREVVAGWQAAGSSIEVDTNVGAVARAGIVVLAIPFASVAPMLDEVGPHFTPDTLAIDVTVPVTFAGGKLSLIDVPEGSAAEHVRARLPGHVALAGTFKTLPAHVLDDLDQPLDCDEFVCGDSDAARTRAMELARAVAGLRPVDVGPLSRARSIEHLAALAITINRRHKIHSARFRIIGLP